MSSNNSNDSLQKGFLLNMWTSSLVQLPLVLLGLCSFVLLVLFVVNLVMHFSSNKHLVFKNWYVFSDYAGLVVSANKNMLN